MADVPARDSALARECDVFCRHLVGQRPTAYVLRKYAEGHRSPVTERPDRDAFDAVLLRLAVLAPVVTRMADAYARLVDRRAVLRRKLVLLVAILESAPPTHAEFASTRASHPVRVLAGLVASGLGFIVALSAGALVLLPVHAVLRIAGGSRRQRRARAASSHSGVVRDGS